MKLKTLGFIFATFFLGFCLSGIYFRFNKPALNTIIVINDSSPRLIENWYNRPANITVEPFKPSVFVPSSRLERNPSYDLFGASCYPLFNNLTDSEFFSRVQYKRFGTCQMDVPSHKEINENIVSVKCKFNKINFYYLDPGHEEVFGWNNLEVKWVKFDGSVEINTKSRQFLFVRCGSKEIYTFIFSKFNKTLSDSAQKKRNIIEKQLNLNSTRPLTIYLLVLESLSRQNFFRSLPQTSRFLQSLPRENLSLFDFSLSNTINIKTKANMMPILYGKSFSDVESEIKILNTENTTTSPAYTELQEKYSIWRYLSRLGYITMFSFDTIYDFLSTNTGKYLSVDVKFLNFWKAGKKVFGYDDFSPKQRCFGNKDSHWFGLEYARQYLETYEGHHRFAYLHLSPGHESNGVIRTLDKDLKFHLEQVFEYYKNTNEDFLLLLMSDHGRGQGRLEFYLEHFIENRMPLILFIGNKNLFSRTGSSEILENNTKRLVSRYDLNLSLKTIALSPYGNPTEPYYNELKNHYPVKGIKSLFLEQIPSERSCLEVGARKIDCICKDYEKVDENNELENAVIRMFLDMAKRTVNKMRTRRRTGRLLDNLNYVKGEVFKIREENEGNSKKYRMQVQDSVEVFWVEGIFATLERFIETRARDEDINGIQPNEIFKQNGIEYQIQIQKISLNF